MKYAWKSIKTFYFVVRRTTGTVCVFFVWRRKMINTRFGALLVHTMSPPLAQTTLIFFSCFCLFLVISVYCVAIYFVRLLLSNGVVNDKSAGARVNESKSTECLRPSKVTIFLLVKSWERCQFRNEFKAIKSESKVVASSPKAKFTVTLCSYLFGLGTLYTIFEITFSNDNAIVSLAICLRLHNESFINSKSLFHLWNTPTDRRRQYKGNLFKLLRLTRSDLNWVRVFETVRNWKKELEIVHSLLSRMEVHFLQRNHLMITSECRQRENRSVAKTSRKLSFIFISRFFSRITYSNQLTCAHFVATTQSEQPEGNKFQCRTATWHSRNENPLRRTVLTCLSISKYACIVSLKCICQYVSSDRIENLLLGGKMHRIRVRRVKAMVKCECFWLFPVVAREQKGTENYTKWNFLFTEFLRETV